ncbi:MAG: hypothetical protein E3J81_03590 [Dehalococcoidia bacterium]|nr:MAG: hypothetical protein E3J81_03590 [Dehalococcoidia bacterium]
MAKKTQKELLAEAQRRIHSLNSQLGICETKSQRLRMDLAAKNEPEPKQETAECAQKILRDVGRIESVLAGWNYAGQIKLLRVLVLAYDKLIKFEEK